MNVFLWIVQVLLAGAFLAAGVMKVSRPRAKLVTNMAWVEDFSDQTVTFIGSVEMLAAVGLILSGALDIAPALTPLAALGIVLLMAGAVVTHARRREPQFIVVNAVLLVLAALVVWGRFGPYSF